MKKGKAWEVFVWGLFALCAVAIAYALFDGAQRAKECRERGGVPVYQSRSAYPTCFDPAVLK